MRDVALHSGVKKLSGEEKEEEIMTTADYIFERGRKEGWDECKDATITSIVMKMKQEGVSSDFISRTTGLPEEKIQELGSDNG